MVLQKREFQFPTCISIFQQFVLYFLQLVFGTKRDFANVLLEGNRSVKQKLLKNHFGVVLVSKVARPFVSLAFWLSFSVAIEFGINAGIWKAWVYHGHGKWCRSLIFPRLAFCILFFFCLRTFQNCSTVLQANKLVLQNGEFLPSLPLCDS